MKRLLISLIVKDMQIKEAMRYHFFPNRLTKVKNCDNVSYEDLRMNLTLTDHNHPKSIWYILGVVHCICLDKCIITCIYHYGVIQSIFSALKIISVPPIHCPCPLPHDG